MIRKFATTALFASIVATGIATAGSASAAGSWTCHGTSGSGVDPASSCVTQPAPVSHPQLPFGIRHRHRALHW